MSERRAQRLSPLTPVVRSFIVVVAAATTIVRDVTRGDMGPAAMILGAVLVGGAIYGTASWVRTKFWIEADELRVDTGVISRQSRRIRIDRLQGIDIVQPFVARLFGLAELRMDVAGGSAREGSLAYLPLSEARRLKDLLLARRDQLDPRRAPGPAVMPGHPGELAAPGVPGTAPGSLPSGAVAPHRPPRPDRVLARVDLGRLLLSILLSGETVVLLLVGLATLGTFAATGRWLGFSVLVPVLIGTAFAQFRRFSANYRFTVSETEAGLQLRRGLFDLNSQTIALSRVQGVVITQPALWRTLGWARLDVSIAGYASLGGAENGPSASTVLPVGDLRVTQELARHVLRGLDLEQVRLRPVPARVRWIAPVARRFLMVGTDERLVVSREGWLNRRTHAAPQARIQSVRITQGPWQRRLDLADVHADSPPGPAHVRARHRDAAEARRLFGVEVAMGGWARRQLPAWDR